MKTGIIRRIDDLGRIVIPKAIRYSLGIKEGDPLEISVENNKVCLEHYLPGNIDVLDSLIQNIRSDEYLEENKDEAVKLLVEARKLLKSQEEM